MRHAVSHDWSSTFDVEVSLQKVLRESADSEEGVRAFLEKRKANFKGQ
jgi:enoyl-CoA hydratase/carnithine racemase